MALLSLIILISIFEILGILKYFAAFIIDKCQNLRQVALVVLLLSFFGSMFFTNDVAILTLVPIVFNIDRKVKLPKIGLISLMTIYANLGSAITPIGNPQKFVFGLLLSFKTFRLFQTILTFRIGQLIDFIFMCLIIFKESCQPDRKQGFFYQKTRSLLVRIHDLNCTFGRISFDSCLDFFNCKLGLCLSYREKVYQEVDYGIILTFINFFIIVGALGRIPLIHDWLHQLMNNDLSIFFTSILSSQIISNVPAAVLLSKFTGQLSPLYLGVTIGGLGTLVASLANLLALRQYQLNVKDQSTLKFFGLFTFLNFLYLLVFIGIGILFLR
ncbi:MAG: carboxylate transporter [Lactococcus lactis]|nr:carboxylate transporter [Lactococcus lactis]